MSPLPITTYWVRSANAVPYEGERGWLYVCTRDEGEKGGGGAAVATTLTSLRTHTALGTERKRHLILRPLEVPLAATPYFPYAHNGSMGTKRALTFVEKSPSYTAFWYTACTLAQYRQRTDLIDWKASAFAAYPPSYVARAPSAHNCAVHYPMPSLALCAITACFLRVIFAKCAPRVLISE